MKVENSLNPNCSEAVIRFSGLTMGVDTSSLGALIEFADKVRDEVKELRDYESPYKEVLAEPLVFYDNLGGGANCEALARIIYLVIQEVYKNKPFDANKFWDEEPENWDKKEMARIIDGPIDF